MSKKKGIYRIITLTVFFMMLTPLIYSQTIEEVNDVLGNYGSETKTNILNAIEDASFIEPNNELLRTLNNILQTTTDKEIKMKTLNVIRDYALDLDNVSVVKSFWNIVKQSDDPDIIEECYKSLKILIPELKGFPEEEIDNINEELGRYDDSMVQALSAGLEFYAVVINEYHKPIYIKDFVKYLRDTDSEALLGALKAYSSLYNKYTEDIENDEYFTKNELSAGSSAIATNLSSNNSLIKQYSIIAVGNCQYEDKDTILKLISILRDPSESNDIKSESATALGKIGSDLASDVLYQTAIDDRNKDLQASALLALSYMPESVDLASLSYLRYDNYYKIRENFLRLVVAVIKKTKDKELTKYFMNAIRKKDWGGSLVQAALGYGEVPTKENIEYLEELLNYEEGSYNSFVRIAASKSLSKHKFKSSEKLLLERLEVEKNLDVIKILLDSLAVLGYDSSIKGIAKWYTNDNREIAILSLDAVSRIGGDKAKDSLLDFVVENPKTELYDFTLTLLQNRLGVDKMEILQKTNPSKYYYEIAKSTFIKAENLTNKEEKQAAYEETIEKINQSINLNKEYANSYYIRGVSYFNIDKVSKAESDLEKALKLGITDSNIYLGIGIVKFTLEKYEEAIDYFYQYADKSKEGDATVYLYLSTAQLSKGDYDKALESANQFWSVNPDDSRGLKALADIYHVKKEYGKAITYMEQYLEQYPNDIDAKYQIAIDYLNSNNNEKCRDYLEEVIIEVQDQYPRAYFFLGLAYLRMGDYEIARNYFEKFVIVVRGNEELRQKNEVFIKRAKELIENIDKITDLEKS